MKRKGWSRKSLFRLESARVDFIEKCVSEVESHPVKFRVIKAIGVPCGEVIAYVEKRYRITGAMPTPWKAMCSFERRLRRILKKRKEVIPMGCGKGGKKTGGKRP